MRKGKICTGTSFWPLASAEATKRVDLVDPGVGHREAADRLAVAMHHDLVAAEAVATVIGVGIADVEGEMIVRMRVELACADT